MSGWAIVALVAVIVWGAVQIIERRHDGKKGVVRDEDGNPVFPPADNAETRAEIHNLRDRIKVLERIATENNTLGADETRRISAEIEQLRDQSGTD